MRFLAVNLDSFLIELNDPEHTVALFRHLETIKHPHIVEMIPAATTILVYFDRLNTEVSALIRYIKSQRIERQQRHSVAKVVIDVTYDGPDLHHVAELLGVTVSEVIYRHSNTCWNVAFIGFAPGFGYLNSPDHPFGSIPRLSSPRKKIQAGSVALAGEYTGIYPKDSPGGWQLIGSTPQQMWDVHRDPPALLRAGAQVIFRDITRQPSHVVVPEIKIPKQPEQHLQPVFELLQTGLQSLVQDQGRTHQAALGVGRSGAMDQTALFQANRIVGNPDHAAVIEILNGGLKLKVLQSTVVAVTGAASHIGVSYAGQAQVKVPDYSPIALDCGDLLYIDSPHAGLRHYLAIRGGIKTEKILGSASFDTLAELGTPPLKPHDFIYSAELSVGSVLLHETRAQQLPKIGDVVEIDVIPGPRTDWFEPESLTQFFQQQWLVTQESNRIGLRLSAGLPLKRQIHGELASEGTCTGALQIPPNGQPVLFMNDHPLTGGYPVLGAVASDHLDRVAQIPPGCLIQFRQKSEILDLDKEST
ncbi:5-oxoprolinase/urea amidolyase family protein [Acinetobacter baylyi]|uniref:5-oxoprolinase subunit B/C family protein n=1 Tax=Acinetobacter baylyi TaxID=202950 RepID=UPI0031E3A82D